jgi:hypothetical protein
LGGRGRLDPGRAAKGRFSVSNEPLAGPLYRTAAGRGFVAIGDGKMNTYKLTGNQAVPAYRSMMTGDRFESLKREATHLEPVKQIVSENGAVSIALQDWNGGIDGNPATMETLKLRGFGSLERRTGTSNEGKEYVILEAYRGDLWDWHGRSREYVSFKTWDDVTIFVTVAYMKKYRRESHSVLFLSHFDVDAGGQEAWRELLASVAS